VVDLKELPLIHSYDSIQALNRTLDKGDREHDLVISVSYSKLVITFWRIDDTYLAVAPLIEEIMVFYGTKRSMIFSCMHLCGLYLISIIDQINLNLCDTIFLLFHVHVQIVISCGPICRQKQNTM